MAACLMLSMAGCANQAPRAVRPAPPVPPQSQYVPPPVLRGPVGGGFTQFLQDFRRQALAQGITPQTYDRAMAHVTQSARAGQLNAAQPEFVRPVWEYLDSAVSPARVAKGQQEHARYAATLAAIETRYGVPGDVLLAIWGMETDYGASMGNFSLFQTLANLAYDGPRTDYARPELLAALRMVQSDGFAPSEMTSSWAGAFGHTQFVPTAYFAHAVDFDGDGRKDLWHSVPDALASAAALLADSGWRRGEVWGTEVRLPAGFAYQDADLGIVKPLEEWRARGVRTALGETLRGPQSGAIYLPAGARGPAFLVFDNFNALLKYNNAGSYALAVGVLADRIGGSDGVIASWPRDEQSLTREQRFALQRDLAALGFDPGVIDGVLGRKVRAALRAWQLARGLPADGFPTVALLRRLDREAAAKS